MASFLQHRPPHIADVQCSRIQFQPGDRVLVRVYVALSQEQERRLKKSIQRWAGCDVEVLIVNAMQMDVTVEKASTAGRIMT